MRVCCKDSVPAPAETRVRVNTGASSWSQAGGMSTSGLWYLGQVRVVNFQPLEQEQDMSWKISCWGKAVMSEGLHVSRWSRTLGHSLCAWCWGRTGVCTFTHFGIPRMHTHIQQQTWSWRVGAPWVQARVIKPDRGPCCILSPDKGHHVPRQERPWGREAGGDGCISPTSLNPSQPTQDLLGSQKTH